MKRNAKLIVVAAVFMLLVGIVGFAYSEGNTAPAKCGTASCPKFVDNNKDGVCDSSAVHHKDGKCANSEQCKKDGKCQGACKSLDKNGKCDMSKCSMHSTDSTQTKAAGAACPSMTNGKCAKTGKTCGGSH